MQKKGFALLVLNSEGGCVSGEHSGRLSCAKFRCIREIVELRFCSKPIQAELIEHGRGNRILNLKLTVDFLHFHLRRKSSDVGRQNGIKNSHMPGSDECNGGFVEAICEPDINA